MSNPSYSILIPVFNAQDSLPLLLNELLNLDDHDKPDAIIVVDDGSTDGTVKKICKYNINLHKTGKNMGKGYALRTGFDSFLKDLTSEYILCMDADLQHSPNSIKDFKSNAKESGNLVEIGLRDISIGKMPFARFLSNKITSYILSVLCKQKLKDSQCGYRLIHRSVIKDMPLYENGFQLESEFLIRCSEKNIKIEFIPIPTVYNKHGSNIKHFYDSLKFLKLVIKEVRKKWFIPNKEKKMIARLREKGISDELVLKAMNTVPRHKFVAMGVEFQAYDEKALPIGFEQTISHPYTVALMSQSLNVQKNEKILEIGTGSGYQAAVLLEMGAQVFTIERIPALAKKAEAVLRELKYHFAVRAGDGTLGWQNYAPYDSIIITAGAPVSPQSLMNQLKNGGKLLIPVGDRNQQILTMFIKQDNEFKKIEIEKLSFVPLIGQDGW